MPGSALGSCDCISTDGMISGNDFLCTLNFFAGEFLLLLTEEFSLLLTIFCEGLWLLTFDFSFLPKGS